MYRNNNKKKISTNQLYLIYYAKKGLDRYCGIIVNPMNIPVNKPKILNL